MTRLAMLGKPTIRGRLDLLQRFFTAAYLAAADGADAAQSSSLDHELRMPDGRSALASKFSRPTGRAAGSEEA